MACKWLTVARLWREALLDAEVIWANLLEYTDEDLKANYRRLLVKYDVLLESLREALKDETHGQGVWSYILNIFTTRRPILSDLSEYGCLTEKGFKAAMLRMDAIRAVQETYNYHPEFIEKQQEIYRQHWLEHPRLAFEVPKANLHELCLTIVTRANDETIAELKGKPLPHDEKSLICTCVKNHFAFSRELAYQDPNLLTNLPKFNDEIFCVYWKCKNWKE